MQDRDQMILQHMPLVAFVVGRMSTDRQKPLGLDREDAMGYGIEGLIQAVDSFDPKRGTSFASFALRRIRGSILDAIRRADPLPRSLRKSARELEKASQELAAQLGRWPTVKEVAMKMGIRPSQVQQIMKHSTSRVVSLDQVLQDRENEGIYYLDPLDDDEQGDPAQAAERQASLDLLGQAVAGLSPRDRAIIQLRYSESMPFHQIGEIMGLSESRVCQLHKRVIATLRREMTSALEEAA
jgi:RNA polymerase sigma factor for flagellar operon FliA